MVCYIETFGHKGKIIIKQLEEARVRGGSIKDRVKGNEYIHMSL